MTTWTEEKTSMQKQLFALTTIATFAALTSATAVTGCSDAGIATSSDGGASDSSTRDARKPPATDDEPDEPDEVLCYKADPIDVSSIGYKPARHRPGSCTGEVFKVIKDLLTANNGSVSYLVLKDELAKSESAECAECVFGDDGDAWAPVVSVNDTSYVQNRGGGFEALTGDSSCGEAAQKFFGCLDTACKDCGNANERSSCRSDVQTSACREPTQAMLASCGGSGKVNELFRECQAAKYVISMGATIQHLCVAPAKDAGVELDAGADAD